MTNISTSSITTISSLFSTTSIISRFSKTTTSLLRTALCLAMMFCVSLSAWAQGWNGTTAVKPVGSGTTEDPYIIATPENLYYISKNIATVKDKVFVQTADIDLSGKEWAPIGNSSNVFSGTYDGQGHTIGGLYVDWGGYMLLGTNNTKTTDTHYSYGLFGYFSGTVRNLQIDGARIVQEAQTADSEFANDKRVAVLVGNVVVSKDITIENIIVRNSEIVGCKAGDFQQKASAYMIGGIVGDIHAGSANNGADKFEDKTVNVSNIYSEVDIKLPFTALMPNRAANKGHQYYVGGVLGRARYNKLAQMPKNVIYKGEVNAPMAIVGPIFSEARNTAAGTTTFAHHFIGYAGDLPDKSNGSAKTAYYTGIYYYDYKVWDYSDATNAPTSATLINTDNLHHNGITIAGNDLDTYTFSTQGTYTGTISLTAATRQQMSMLQGVNRGTLLSTHTDLEDKAEKFFASDTEFAWDFSASNRNLNRHESVSLSLTANSDYSFTASFSTKRTPTSGSYTLKWFGIEGDNSTLLKEETIADGKAKTLSCLYLANVALLEAVVYDGNQPLESQIGEVAYNTINTIVEYDCTPDEGAYYIVTPKAYIVNRSTNVKLLDVTESFTFKVEVTRSTGELALRFDTPNHNNGTAFRLPPNTNTASKIRVVGTFEESVISTELETIPIECCIQLSTSGLSRELLAEGVRTTVELKMGATTTIDPATGNEVSTQKSVAYSDDWGMTVTWLMKYNGKVFELSDDPDPWNKVTDCGVTDDGKLWGFKGDHALVGRNMLLRLVDAYGFTAERSNDVLVVPVSNNRWLRDDSEFQTYYFEYKMSGANVSLNGSTSKYIDYKYKVDIDPVQNNWRDLEGVENDLFTIKKVHMADAKYTFKMLDKYGAEWSSFSVKTLKAPTSVDFINEGGLLLPEFVIDKNKYRFQPSEWDLTYKWTVKYYDDSDQLMTDKTKTFTSADLSSDPYEKLPTPNYVGGAARAMVELEVTDFLDNKQTFKKIYSLDNPKVDVEQAGTAPNYTFTANLSTLSGFPLSGGTWQWYGINGDILEDTSNRFILDGETTSTLTLNSTNNNYSSYCVVWMSPDGKVTLVGYWSKKDIVYVYDKTVSDSFKNGKYATALATYPDGNDFNDGRTPQTAVKTMARAYELLDADRSAKENLIVVMGYLADADYLTQNHNTTTGQRTPKPEYKKNATITGTYGEITTEGTLMLHGGDNTRGLNGATTFTNITLNGLAYDAKNHTNGSTQHMLFYCNLNDLTIGNNVKVQDYTVLGNGMGQLSGTSAPYITIVGGFHQYDNLSLDYPSGNAVPGRTTITIQSGNWGRIIASARNNGQNGTSNNVFGHPDAPHRVTVNVVIKHTVDTNGTENKNEYTPGKSGKDSYTYDIGLLVGGQTDGTVFVDSKIYMSSGTVGRFISGNISYGRSPKTGGFPSDGFFGSTELTLEGGEIKELVGGSQGRHGDNTNQASTLCEAYFYGRSILNINGGVIGTVESSGNLTGNIYGAGAGGVVGLGDNENHTKDIHIPYYTGTKDANGRNTVAYGDYTTVKDKMPKMPMDKENEHLEIDPKTGKRNVLDLSKSYCEINVKGGTINGNIYGGGYGYSPDIDVAKALNQAGNLYGRSYVNITGGTIKGNVYGGGAGSTEYYNKATGEAKANFEDLANVFGDTHVNITGGIIEGKVFAGSKGISGFPNMATVTGNTNLTIENSIEEGITRVPIINNNIYGGSELGKITGNTNVEIKGGAIGNCIFGGSEGIAADYEEKDNKGKVTASYKKTTAHIGGDTNVEITGGTYFTDVHNQKISSDNRLEPKDRTFNIYGGGYNNCVIVGNTNVKITRSLFTSKDNLLETDKYPTFLDCVNDKTYRKFSVYGAGRGELTVVEKNANLDIDIEGGQVVPSKVPETLAKEQQFFMIAGGGFAGNVWGNTYVHLDGYVFARRIYGGGMYGNIYGSANLTVHGGSYHGVFGGGLLGDIMMGANLNFGLRVGDKLKDGTEITPELARNKNRFLYVYENVYGGNDVGGCSGYEFTDNLWNDGSLVAADGHTLFKTISDELTEDEKPHHYLIEHPNPNGDGNYKRLVSASEKRGVNMKIYGGTILGDVFGAGNGKHMGYYVPNNAKSEHYSNPDDITRMLFHEGPAYLYRVNKKDKNSYKEAEPAYDATTNTYTGTLRSVLEKDVREHYGLYEYRPRVGMVEMHIGGNSDEDRVTIGGDVYGGGHACTIGKYDPSKDVLTDPLRFEGGGLLKMNYGSHVRVGGSVYMGSSGRIIGQQTVVEDNDHYASTTLNSDYDYHYYDKKSDKYLLGFPNSLEGRMRFHAYIKLVNMDADVSLTFEDPITEKESTDLRWGSFFAGGARGSMTKLIDETHPAYEFTLPAGLTVETRVVGGSEDADITYYQYKDNTFKEIVETKPLFTFYGGIVYDSREVGHYGGGRVKWHDKSFAEAKAEAELNGVVLSDEEKMLGDESSRGSLVVMKLTVNCQFDPRKAIASEEDGEQYWGGLVYGGCYNSGITNGSVEVTCSNTLLGSVDAEFDNFQDYLAASSLRRNVGRVYGGGFGENSDILGNTKVHLTGNFKGFNVFGGGMMGNVIGGTDVIIDGKSYIYNAVYGGGMRGNVGLPAYDYLPETGSELWPYKDIHSAPGTHITAISGGIDRLYGGAFMGNVYGGTHIEANDQTAMRLMIGSIYGGNDVSGKVEKGSDIHITETPIAEKKDYHLSIADTEDPTKFYGGYPMIGTVYGAGNGNMADYIPGVYINRETHKYSKGKIHIANGDGAKYDVFDFEKENMLLPDLATSRINIEGGTIINVYGGGSMCTTTEKDEIIINYKNTKARAAYKTKDKDPMTWGVLRLFNDIQQNEVTESVSKTVGEGAAAETTEYTQFSHQIYRVFGGNNLMDMDIQPTWNLQSGHIFSLYSGGNFGKMRYYNSAADPNSTDDYQKYKGLFLTINPDVKENLRISSVYGGGRVGDIEATDKTTKQPITFGTTEYGATLNIKNGIIGDVFGGNNVAGNVRNGTNVNISGAISGNVYGSGNGNYIYLYDWNETHRDENLTGQQITEGYDEKYGGRYFILPKKVAYYNGTTPVYYGSSDEEKILAINRYRPNVEKAYLKIEGTEGSPVFVRGNVYCGGNSSTVLYNPSNPGDIKFEIGSNVTLGGVFLGSNGEGLANDDEFHITYLSKLNDIDLTKENKIAEREGFQFTTDQLASSPLFFNDKVSYDTSLYPNVLSLYMRAAEVTALPSNFALPPNATNAYIGNFTLGGNYGSMMTDKTIDITMPENLTIFGRIVGGCYNSLVEFNGAKAMGGMTKPLSTKINSKTTNRYVDDGKVKLTIKSKFRPWRLDYNEETHAINLVDDLTDFNGNPVDADYFAAHPDSTYYTEGLCNIFGGCYTSGKTVGDISIDLYSDVLGYYENGKNWDATETETIGGVEHKRRKVVDRDILMNNVSQRRTVYAVTGGGYGALSEVEGNTHIRLLPQTIPSTSSTLSTMSSNSTIYHPTISTIFGGAHNGKQIGNSTTEIRDGMVFSNIYAGSRAAMKYGSSEVIVGYPKYYICKESGEFTLDRADKFSRVAEAAKSANREYSINGKTYHAYNEFMEDGVKKTVDVIKKTVKYRKGDIVAANVYEQITNSDKASNFEEKHDLPTDTQFGSKWANIDINIGDNSQMNNPAAKFYGGGGIYGGGHAINESAQTYSGVNTQLAFDAEHNPDENSETSASIGYGGNSTISIGDDTAGDKSHISIGTAHYVKLNLKPTDDKISTYLKKTEGGKTTFVHQSSGTPESGKEYYKMETDGGVFGDGHRTFVQNFRAVDITGYGYADYTPQSAKLINTFQRIDLLSLTDCCLQLQGAKDYATNTIDATYYSISRIGELRMNSSLNSEKTIEQSVADGENIGNMSLNVVKSRNYLGFFKKVHYVGALYSNTSFDSPYRSNFGTKGTKTYRQEKQDYIDAYENSSKDNDAEKAFTKRNFGSAPNMIGINNGYSLTIQNAFTTVTETSSTTNGNGEPATGSGNEEEDLTMLSSSAKDNIYYGPIVGVVEVKLLTVQADEGGGYIYALNHHEDKSDKTGKTFLEDSGNFVFAAKVSGSDVENYIIDDCYPFGYYANSSNATNEEAHYWYVKGHNYFFNTTLTGYTYDKPIDFYLNNADALILLSGITASNAQSITVESVNWRDHADVDENTPYKSALMDNLNTSASGDSREKYQLFLSIDANTDRKYELTSHGNAFVAQIPNGNGTSAYGLGNNGKIQTAGPYQNIDASTANNPLLGIRLQDTDIDNNDPTFYKDHLSDEDYVVIKIKALESGTAGANDAIYNTYTINLTINYLQGPHIKGKVNIENCALPGEYIYANTEGISMLMDEELTVTGKRWYLYPKTRKTDATGVHYEWDTDGKIDVTKYVKQDVAGDINRLQLPARYYQNDWQLDYVVEVNGQEFGLNNSAMDIPRLTVHNYHRMSTLAKEVKQMTDVTNGVGATNYGYDLDLDLVGGALVYIESNEDFELFTKYVYYCNVNHAGILPGFNRQGGVTLQNVKNPSGAENIRFVLTTDIETTANCMPIGQFRGRLNGNGHVIHFKSGYQNKNFIEKNYGSLDYVGFVSSGGADTEGITTAVVNENYGSVNNCFYYAYNPPTAGADIDYSDVDDVAFKGSKYASLVQKICKKESAGDNRLWIGTVDNCYQNTDYEQTAKVQEDAKKLNVRGSLSYRSSQSFHNGMIAYNLNQEYLKARYKSHDNDALVREQMVASKIDENDKFIEGDYLYDYYADGEYRYAYVYDVNEHPEALRLAASEDGWPNYEDRMRTGKSMHKIMGDAGHDERRWFTTTRADLIQIDERGQIKYEEKTETVTVDGVEVVVKRFVPVTGNTGYFPLYLHDADNTLADHSDFIFFGQRMTTDKEKRQYFPNRVTYENRVYRAGGFYGSRVDSAFHFNREAWAMLPALTAIDFTGYYDVKGDDGYKEGWQDNEDGSTLLQHVYYPPVLDLPGGDRSENLHNIKSFKIDSNVATESGKENIESHNRVTRNLLVYTPTVGEKYDNADEERLFGKLHYTRMQDWGQTETDQNDIIGHHISLDASVHFHAYGGLFHLVDKQDFNAPIDFYVVGDGDVSTGTNGRAWYLRKPKHYASRNKKIADDFVIGKDAWESISLPFTANRVWALNTEYDVNGNFSPTNVYSRGEITHFYGSDPKWGITHHDYWLRGLVGGAIDSHTDDIKAEANFARPGESYTDSDGNDVLLFELPKEDINGDGVEDTQMHGDYSYLYLPIDGKSWFTSAYGNNDGTGGYMDSHSDYDEAMPFNGYPYLTKNAPYIVAYPGEDYYEFDLTGKFYKKMNDTEACKEQTIMYEFSVDKIDPNNNFAVSDKKVLIPITNIYTAVRTTSVNGTGINLTHNATFSRIAGTQITDNMYVLNETAVTAVNAHGTSVEIPAGAAFINCNDFGITEILPFRTYLTADVPAGSSKPRYIMVGDGTRGIDSFGDEEEKSDEKKYSGVNLFVRGSDVVITSDHDFTCPLYGYSGQLYRQLTVRAGENVYKNLPSGVYVALGKKFVLRRN